MEANYEKRIKLLAIDIDGTLFNSEHVASPYTRNTLHELLASGVQPIIATGRPRIYSEQLLDELALDIPYISSNGAVIINGKNNEVCYSCETRLGQYADEMITWIEQNEMAMMCEFPDGTITRYASDEVIASFDEDFQAFFHMFPMSENPREEYKKPIIKMSFRRKGREEFYAEEIRSHFPALNFVNSGYDCVDFTAMDAHKGNAIRIFAERAGIDLSQVAAIGDQTNDITMLQTVGLPIAMGNAVDELKAIARWIVPTNDEDGAAYAMRKIMELNEKIA